MRIIRSTVNNCIFRLALFLNLCFPKNICHCAKLYVSFNYINHKVNSKIIVCTPRALFDHWKSFFFLLNIVLLYWGNNEKCGETNILLHGIVVWKVKHKMVFAIVNVLCSRSFIIWILYALAIRMKRRGIIGMQKAKNESNLNWKANVVNV